MEILDWHGLYGERWTDMVDEAISHPAKFNRGLIRRIYRQMANEGWLKPGDVVLDPFAGVCGGAIDAMAMGCSWVGVELEERFVDLGQQNIENWKSRYEPLWLDKWGHAVVLQGDSRQLAKIVRSSDVVVSSPPYTNSVNQNAAANDAEARIDRKAQAGIDVGVSRNVGGPNSVLRQPQRYGDLPGQLGAMPKGNVSAVIGSPPYAGSAVEKNSPSINLEKMYETYRSQGGGMSFAAFEAQQARHSQGYGKSPGQMATMPEGAFSAVISSPPFGAGETRDRAPVQEGAVSDCITRAYTQDRQGTTDGNLATMDAVVSSPPYEGSQGSPSLGSVNRDDWGNEGGDIVARRNLSAQYGNTQGQVGHTSGDTFWSAARIIVAQCHAVLKPGGIAVWVVKRFVRKKQIVPFPDQWESMCESVGFEPVTRARAWMIEDRGTQVDLWGNGHQKMVERKSFFRRLYESKYPENRIDWEDVLFMEKL